MIYSRVVNHGSMIFDNRRNEIYAHAIRHSVRPNAVVLDLGAGLGIHGLLAVAAGASRVYMVEPEPVINATKDIARANGVSEKLILIQSRIEEASLPESVDLIVSVFTGNLLYTEDLLPVLFRARDRYLKPGGRMLPDRAQLWIAPLCAAELHRKHVGRWNEPVMGFDYSAARQFAANNILYLRATEFQGSELLAAGNLIADLDLTVAVGADCNGATTFRIESSGLCHALLGWTRIRLGEQWLSTAPSEPEVHWSPVMLPIDPPLALEEGEFVDIKIRRPEGGDWFWSIRAAAGSRRHSTFFTRAEASRELSVVAPSREPGLGPEGHRAARILELFDQGFSIRAAAEQLAASESMTSSDALAEVQALAMRYGARL
jgi:SAM-dependent methyltransferase